MITPNHTNITTNTDGDYIVLRPDRQSTQTLKSMQSKIAQIMRDHGITTYYSTPLESLHITLFNHLNGTKSDENHSYGLTPSDRRKLMQKVAEKISTIYPFTLKLTVGNKSGGRQELGIDAGSNLNFPKNLGVRLILNTDKLDLLREKICEAVQECGIAIDESKLNYKGTPYMVHELKKNFHPHISIGTLDLRSDQSRHNDIKLLNEKVIDRDAAGNPKYNSDGTVKTYRKIEREIRRQLYNSADRGGLRGAKLSPAVNRVELLGSDRLYSHDETKQKKPSARSNVELETVQMGSMAY